MSTPANHAPQRVPPNTYSGVGINRGMTNSPRAASPRAKRGQGSPRDAGIQPPGSGARVRAAGAARHTTQDGHAELAGTALEQKQEQLQLQDAPCGTAAAASGAVVQQQHAVQTQPQLQEAPRGTAHPQPAVAGMLDDRTARAHYAGEAQAHSPQGLQQGGHQEQEQQQPRELLVDSTQRRRVLLRVLAEVERLKERRRTTSDGGC